MANNTSIVVAFAGSKQAVNEAILLMAQNAAESCGEPAPARFDDPADSYASLHALVDAHVATALAGKNASAQYVGDTDATSYFDNGENCSFALRYTCGDGFNENDLRLFSDALNERLAEGDTYITLAILANEGDRWENLTIKSGERGALDNEETLWASELLNEAAGWFKRNYGSNKTPKLKQVRGKNTTGKVAKRHATSLWNNWNNESVMLFLEDEQVLNACDDEFSKLALGQYQDEVISCYLNGTRELFRADEWDEEDIEDYEFDDGDGDENW